MIKELLDNKTKQKVIKMSNNIINNSNNIDYIATNLDYLRYIIYTIMNDKYNHYYLAAENSILRDDILEMDSISEEEKNNAIRNLILINKNNFIELAHDILSKIQSDKIEAGSRGFCNTLIEEVDVDSIYHSVPIKWVNVKK